MPIIGAEEMRLFIEKSKHINLTKLAGDIGLEKANFHKFIKGQKGRYGNHIKMTLERADKLYEVLKSKYGYDGIRPYSEIKIDEKSKSVLVNPENVKVFSNLEKWLKEE